MKPNTLLLTFFLTLSMPHLVSCGSSSETTSTANPTSGTFSTSLNGAISNEQLVAGVPKEIKFTFTVPGGATSDRDFTARGAPSINITETLKSVTLSSIPITEKTGFFETIRMFAYLAIKEAFANTVVPTEVNAYIAAVGDPYVCSTGYKVGPVTFSGLLGGAASSTASSVEVGDPAVDIINAGSFDVCLVAVPPVDMYMSVANVVVDFAECTDAGLNIEGTWAGTYSCKNYGPGAVDEGGSVSMTISKNVDGSYHYTDNIADYTGHLCDHKLKFKGGTAANAADPYTESGTFSFNSDTVATKSSRWVSADPLYGGICTDTLNKM